ncbi:MAG: oligosaccharide flippase family protein [Thermoplasmata archaeon]
MTLAEKVTKGIAWNFVATSAGVLVGVLSSIVLARMLGKVDWGAFSVVASFSSVISTLAALGLDFAPSRFIPEYGKRWSLLRRIIKLRLIPILAFSVPLFFLSDNLAQFLLHDFKDGIYFKIVAVTLIPIGLSGVYQSFLQSTFQQKFTSVFTLAYLTFNFLYSVYALNLGLGVLGILMVQLIGNSMLAVGSAYWLHATVLDIDKGECEISSKRILEYSIVLGLYLFMNMALGKELDTLMIGSFIKDENISAGYYNIAYTFSFTLLSFFSNALMGGMMVASISELYVKKNFEGLRNAYKVYFEYLYFFVTPSCALGLIFSEEFISVLYGEEYLPAAYYAFLYFPILFIAKLGGINATYLSSTDSEKKLLVSRLIFGSVNFTLNLFLISFLGVTGAIIGTMFATIFGTAYESVLVDKLVKPTYPVRFLAKVGIASVLAALACYPIRKYLISFGLSEIFVLLIGLGIMAACYLAFVKLLSPFSKETKDIIVSSKIPMKRILAWFIK